MKTACLLLCLLWTLAALGQTAAVLSSQPQPLEIPSHPEHASQQPMAEEQFILTNSGFTVGHGERPLWEMSHPTQTMPLGDVARLLRKEHATAKKAVMVLER